MKEGSSVNSHLNESNALYSQLTLKGLNFDDEMKAIFLLCSLLASWDTFNTAISNSTHGGKLAFGDVTSALLTEEIRRQSLDSGGHRDVYMAGPYSLLRFVLYNTCCSCFIPSPFGEFITSTAAFTMADNNTYGIWNIVQGIDVRPGSVDVAEVVDVAGPPTRIAVASGGNTNVNSSEANVQPMGVFENVTDQPIIDVDVHDVLDEERAENEQARGSRHASYASDCYALAVSSLHDVEEPLSFDEAQNSKNWMAAMQSKYDALIENGRWTLCDLPLGKKAIGTKWVYKLKRKPDGEIDCYKARLVAKGYA
ncbi:hypothetical protein L7F22_011491 [Adiantum nelumboides]|nr:hypothetical protein [Adiantum nelumboides]